MNTHCAHESDKSKSNKMGKLYRMHFETNDFSINLAGKHEEGRPLGTHKSKWRLVLVLVLKKYNLY
jgi:hypothetical protein